MFSYYFLFATCPTNAIFCSLLCLTSSLNPVIYCWKMIQVRRGTVRTLQNIFLRRNWTEGSYGTSKLPCLNPSQLSWNNRYDEEQK
ncbi:unnamed protein product [Pocillopora meandrina]|uniref:G-protein coupled receptors family 1 profile domain-containing protein n=1 Tax=Pocillopora meandrina TaxID=46732 RepID=A0AAU9WIJ7_9CNID|nr:unnamed protein product [Pocillopora meandrina]